MSETGDAPSGKKKGPHRDKRLSAVFVRTVTKPGRYNDGLGLMLVVDASGAKRWAQRLLVRGRRCDIGLGSLRDVSLAEARDAAAANRKVARAGGDPLEAKRAAQAKPTFAEAAEGLLRVKAAELSNAKHAAQWRSTLETYAFPRLGHLRVDHVDRAAVLEALQPIWTRVPETAKRTRARIEAVLSWATAAKHRAGDNPARWKDGLDALLPKPEKVAKKKHHPALSQRDVPRWWRRLTGMEGTAARALMLVALTWARSGEVRGATWGEIDLRQRVWLIPAERMKAKREHRVPLTQAAVDLLNGLPRIQRTDLIFPGTKPGRPLSDMTLSAVMRRAHAAAIERAAIPQPGDEPWVLAGGFFDPRSGRPAVPHGLRSTARDWATERGFDRDMAELQLAHDVGSSVERAYRRSDMVARRLAMLEEWSAYLHSDPGVPFEDEREDEAGDADEAAKVVPIARRA